MLKSSNNYKYNISSASSYNPIGSCEMYIGCKFCPYAHDFPNLKENDGLLSAPPSSTYNCISWSGGICSYW